jgi:hypothetical protein
MIFNFFLLNNLLVDPASAAELADTTKGIQDQDSHYFFDGSDFSPGTSQKLEAQADNVQDSSSQELAYGLENILDFSSTQELESGNLTERTLFKNLDEL